MKEGLVSPSITKERDEPIPQLEQGGAMETVRLLEEGSIALVQGIVTPAERQLIWLLL